MTTSCLAQQGPTLRATYPKLLNRYIYKQGKEPSIILAETEQLSNNHNAIMKAKYGQKPTPAPAPTSSQAETATVNHPPMHHSITDSTRTPSHPAKRNWLHSAGAPSTQSLSQVNLQQAAPHTQLPPMTVDSWILNGNPGSPPSSQWSTTDPMGRFCWQRLHITHHSPPAHNYHGIPSLPSKCSLQWNHGIFTTMATPQSQRYPAAKSP